MSAIEDLRVCQECNKEKPVDDFQWTRDRYNIPFKKVCGNCYPKVQAEISKWEFDPSTGENLEPEDY